MEKTLKISLLLFLDKKQTLGKCTTNGFFSPVLTVQCGRVSKGTPFSEHFQKEVTIFCVFQLIKRTLAAALTVSKVTKNPVLRAFNCFAVDVCRSSAAKLYKSLQLIFQLIQFLQDREAFFLLDQQNSSINTCTTSSI